jgi:hypothetical protein
MMPSTMVPCGVVPSAVMATVMTVMTSAFRIC